MVERDSIITLKEGFGERIGDERSDWRRPIWSVHLFLFPLTNWNNLIIIVDRSPLFIITLRLLRISSVKFNRLTVRPNHYNKR
jgi:hypothetical protein